MFCGFDELFETMPHLLEVEFVEPQVAVKKKHASLCCLMVQGRFMAQAG
jgi:hypothetical protein